MITQSFKPADMAREVLDAIREINQIENRLTGILATLLAMDTSVEPVAPPVAIPGDMLQNGSGVGTLVGKTKGSTITVQGGDAEVVENADGSVDVFLGKAEAGAVLNVLETLKQSVTLDELKAGGVNIKGKVKSAVMADVAIRRDAVMDLWAQTNLTQQEIGDKLGLNPRNVRKAIQYARDKGDPRAIDAWRRPQATSSAMSSQQPGGTLRKDASDSLAEGEGESPESLGGSEAENVEEAQAGNEAGSASPTSARSPGDEDSHTSSPAASGAPYSDCPRAVEAMNAGCDVETFVALVAEERGSEPEIDEEVIKDIGEALKPTDEPDDAFVQAVAATVAPPKLTLVKSDFEGDPSDVILFDRANLQIVGPTGVMTVDKPWLKVFRHMADARIYDIRTLAGKGGFSDLPRFYESLRSWKNKLATIGVELVFVGKELFRIRPIED